MKRMRDIKKVEKLEHKALTTQELKKFECALQENGYTQLQDLFTIILNTGVRISEILELKFTDISYNSKSKSYLILIDSIKSRSRQMRTSIMLNDKCMEVLSRLKRKYPNDVFVFQSRNSKNQINKPASPISRQYVMKGFKTASDSIAVPITVSSLRRHYATHMSFKTSQQQIGHKYLSEVLGLNKKSMIGSNTNKSKVNNLKELLTPPKAKLDPTHKIYNEIESILNSDISHNSDEFSNIAKKHSISENDFRTTLKTIQRMKNNF